MARDYARPQRAGCRKARPQADQHRTCRNRRRRSDRLFDTLPHSELLRSVAPRVVDGAMLHLIKMWLTAPVEETDEHGNKYRNTRNRDEGRGSPQGSPISPLL